MRPVPTEDERPLARPTRRPAPEVVHANTVCVGPPSNGCSGEGAASAMQHWLRQREERERMRDRMPRGESSPP